MANRLKRKQQVTAQRQEQILKAALAVFSRRGFGQATVADVAHEAGISVGTIYNYYCDKHDLLLSLITNNLILGNLGNIVSASDLGDADYFVSALVEDRLKAVFSNAQQILFLFFEIQRSAALRRQYSEEVVQPVLNMISGVIKNKVKEGEFRHVNETIIARAFASLIIGVMILYRLEGRDSPFQKSRIPEITVELSHLLLYGLKKSDRKGVLR
jgi:AcrR family transcriptional regulator